MYIHRGEVWLSLARHKDIFTGGFVGYAMGEMMSKNLISQSLFRFVTAKKPEPGLLLNLDVRSQ
jgi:hypothetical protein